MLANGFCFGFFVVPANMCVSIACGKQVTGPARASLGIHWSIRNKQGEILKLQENPVEKTVGAPNPATGVEQTRT